MRINLIAIGKKMPDWITHGIEHYKKQLPKNYNFTITVLESQNRKSISAENTKNLEEKLILDAASGSTLLIAFDELGKQQSSKELSKSIEKWQLEGESVAMIIGGADGLSSELKQKCNLIWSLSNLTLTHSMARLLLVEQLYRGHSLMTNHPYHRS
ncbi:23S rRNA (pseudouridine(1915)-N(3))-methyltransferase RlmH [Candidatus Pseudothioglobus singularis]|uniref:Ribosomal RNA large subunit methyltransferase H n=1 Tax=Candidatus Pseudothioglobus singularis PS1 TaxID=1125411 RepID=A0A0M5KRY2_9GAMM|nr:23S rRNA (pseudouridine(1915)-N(3))-methyltransferase RlmH [Candidatus Pseudothioglobus singularis]ALE02203.1 50S rRNA methyltransferase [Candidatus Pseudothioglobus singularis PS1]